MSGLSGVLSWETIIADDLTIMQATNWIQYCKKTDAEFNLGCCDYFLEPYYSFTNPKHIGICLPDPETNICKCGLM